MSDFPREYHIGPVRIAPATVLAPMAGVTDTVFRRLIRNQGGCGLIMTEFTSSHGVVASLNGASFRNKKPTRTFRYLYFEPEEHPISAQLFGSDPQVMADAAKACQDLSGLALDLQKMVGNFKLDTNSNYNQGHAAHRSARPSSSFAEEEPAPAKAFAASAH